MARSPPRHMRSSGCLSRYTSPRALGDVLQSEQAALRRSFLGLAVGARLLLLCVLRGSSFFPAVGTACRYRPQQVVDLLMVKNSQDP
jgi:hypothetical protein